MRHVRRQKFRSGSSSKRGRMRLRLQGRQALLQWLTDVELAEAAPFPAPLTMLRGNHFSPKCPRHVGLRLGAAARRPNCRQARLALCMKCV